MENLILCVSQTAQLSPKGQHLAGEKLAVHALCRLLQKTEEDIAKNHIIFSHKPSGQPFFSKSDAFVSISHTKTFVAAAVSFFPVGIDLESSERKNLRAAERVFTKEQFDWFLKNDALQENLFAKLWTLHEAYAKYTGLGLAKMPPVCFFPKETMTFCSDPDCLAQTFFPFSGCCLSVCTPKEQEFQLVLEKISIF